MRLIMLSIAIILFCEYSFAEENFIFPNSCAKGKSIIIAAVGDVLLHPPLQKQGAEKGFKSLWADAIPYIKSADIAYANLEGPMAQGINEAGHVANSNSVYTGFPLFNYPPSVGVALKESGFALVSNANNHALDRLGIGVDRTITSLDKMNLLHVGTRTRDSQQKMFHIVLAKDFKIAWIACTAHTNGIADIHHQILYCYNKNDRQWIIDKIHELRHQVDAVIVTPHWGEEYQTQPTSAQINFAHAVLDAGAIAVLGSHPHVLQPLKKYITPDGRTTLIMYSLGNFVSYQGRPQTRATVILLLGLTKTSQGTNINGIRFVPMYMQNRNGRNIFLQRLNKNEQHTLPQQIISNAVPLNNMLYTEQIVTNPECF